ncbi:hypothetical protein JKP88DRAFT_307050 [Tribonema minus]|uniref:Uncharacterized protein n=1 Tax=Tribonema minus TaxID=303371 RepID=A0A836CJH6_9STRA|nr:hypothetical protein JKP88DRAFT_307050 [Tribonema minus]
MGVLRALRCVMVTDTTAVSANPMMRRWMAPLGVQDTTAVSANPMMKRWMAPLGVEDTTAVPLGVQDTTAVSANPMMKRWMAYSEVVGYESFGDSLLSMLDTLLLGNWTLFMDAAFVAIGWPAWWFFYLFKPVLLGFVVQAWMGARVPAAAAPSPPYAPPSPCSSASDDGYSSDDDDRATGLLSHAADCGAGGGGGGDSYAVGDSVGGAMVAAHARRRGSSAGGGGGSSDVVHLAPVPRTLSNFWGPQEAAARESMELQELHEHVDTLEIELAAAKEAAQRLRQQLAISLMRSAFSHRPVPAGLPRHQSTDSVTGSNGSFNSVGGIGGGGGGSGGGDPARRLLRRSTGNYGSTQ